MDLNGAGLRQKNPRFANRLAYWFGGLFIATVLLVIRVWYAGLPILELPGVHQSRLEMATRLLRVGADNHMARINVTLRERRGDAMVLAENRVLAAALEKKDQALLNVDFQRVANRLQRAYPDMYAAIMLLSADSSTIRISSNPQLHIDADDFRSLGETTQPGVIELMEQVATSHGPLVAMTRVITKPDNSGEPNGVRVGVLVVLLALQPLIEVSGESVGPGHHYALIDSDGRTLYSSTPDKTTPMPSAKLPPGFEGVLSQALPNGEPGVVAYRYLQLNNAQGWTLAHYVSEAQALAGVDRLFSLTLMAGFALALFGISMILLVARRVTAPLHQLAGVAKRFGAGHLTERATHTKATPREVAVLSDAFNSMAEHIEASQRSLEATVLMRTAETIAARDQLQAILDALPDLLFEVDSEGRIASYHSHRSDLLAAPPEVFLGKRFADLLPPDAASACQHAINEAVQHGFSSGVTYRLALPQGEHWFELSVAPLHADSKPDQRFIMICRDITERMRANESLQQAASVFGHTREGITITSANGTIVDVNEAFTRITGYSREDVIGQNPRILSSGRQDAEFYKAMWSTLAEQGHWSGEVWNRRKDGEVYAELLTISAIRDGQGTTQRYVALFSDITAIKAHQSQLEHIAHFDALTNLPNRVLLADRLHQAMAQAQRRQQQLAVVYLDLDGFKAINDHHGHEAGDQVLITLASRMKETLREGDTLARMGGDEFVAVLTDLEDMAASVPLLNRLLAAAEQPVLVGDLCLPVSASLGVTFYPQAQDIEADQLLRQADQAMYQAKVAGKNRYCVFDAAHDSSIRDHHESLQRIRLALERGEFVLYYQPKVNMHSGKVIGAEALIRWQHPEKGLLAPAAFLPVIEDHPLAVDVGEWVIDTAVHQMELWHAAGLDLPVSVNIGARQLQQGNFVARLQVILARHPQVHPGSIELEVLETSALNDMMQVSQVIEDCAANGVKFALDDFGTGYSSLTYLKRLRVTMLKIDQSFVRDMLDDPDDLAILQGIIGLAAAFKREVIAEGVETVAHGTALLQLGCELAQGYGIARPMPPDRIPSWAATWQPDAAWSGVMNSGEASRFLDE